jgi:hypothetical protein
VYGGTVRYETFETDEELIGERLENVREYIAFAGCNMDRVQVKAMMSGGRGMTAEDAMRIRAKGFQSEKENGQRGGAAAAPAGAGAMGAGQGAGR